MDFQQETPASNNAETSAPQNTIQPPVQPSVAPKIMPPKNGMKKIWIIIIAVIVAAGVFGGGTYAYFNNKATKQKNDLQAQIDEANVKVAELTTTANQLNANANVNSNINANTNAVVTTDLKTFTSKDKTFNLKYPGNWVLQAIEIGDKGGSLNPTLGTMIISVTTKAKSSSTLSQFASDYPTPKDKITISAIETKTLGTHPTIKELVKIDDPDLMTGYWYFIAGNTNFYTFIVPQTANLTEVENMIASININDWL